MASKTIPVLGAARLSQDTDESTSIERQSSGIGQWAALRSNVTGDNFEVIKVTEDADVSGAVSPFDRPDLGRYLQKPLLGTWEVLVVYRLDRLTRSIADFESLWKFLEANGKTLVSVAEAIDFGTVAGKLMARQLVIFAEYEREMIRARVKNAHDAMMLAGKYPGMQFSFGYIPVKLEKGWGLEPHPVYADIVREIAARVLRGEPLRSICRWLDAEQIPTPRNAVREHKNKKPLREATWDGSSLTDMLKSPAIVGEVTSNGSALRDDSGMAVKRAEPLIDRVTWERVKSVLADNAARRGPNVNVSPLLGVAYCERCGQKMHQTFTKSDAHHTKSYRYYQCISSIKRNGCTSRRIPADTLETLLSASVLAQMGPTQLTEEEEIAGIDYSTQMAELAEAIGALETQITLARAHGQDVTKLQNQQRVHRASLAKLAQDQAKIGRLPEIREIDTGETWSERWERLDWNGRNELLHRKGIRIYAERDQSGMTGAHMIGGRYPVDEQGNPVMGEWVDAREPGFEVTPESIKEWAKRNGYAINESGEQGE
jgi:DNA invertase Pin-like site-specific DNA recombinase